MHVHEQYAAAVSATDGSETSELAEVARLRESLKQIDAAALAEPDAWWAMVVEQAEDGLL